MTSRTTNTTSVVYDLPFGKNRRFASGIPDALDYVIGGWRHRDQLDYKRIAGESDLWPGGCISGGVIADVSAEPTAR